MANTFDKLDWALIQVFITVAETGSLSAAARKLDQSQPTTGRHIKAIEEALGEELFTRKPNGLTPTEMGLKLLDAGKEMRSAFEKFRGIPSRNNQQIKGTVRITASVVVSHFILPTIIKNMTLLEPEIEIEIVPTDKTETLTFREADIAIRMYRPTQPELMTKHIANQQLAIYAAKSLVDEIGQASTMQEFLRYPFVGFDKSRMIIDHFRSENLPVDRSHFKVRTDDQALYWRLVQSGCGAGAMQALIGDNDPIVTRLNFQPPLPPLPIWLTAPDVLKKNASIRRVWDLLEMQLGNL